MGNNNTNSFLGNIFLKGKLECLTGLHIGGSKDKFEIGGVDNPIIKDPVTNYPYIPGSSLKGKLRMLLEFALNAVKDDGKGNFPPSNDSQIVALFGDSAEESTNGPTRLIVRDAYPDAETILMWENTNTETLYTEYKAENTIDRMTSAANPRFMERVLKGSKFDVEFILQVFSMDEDKGEANFNNLKQALSLLEDSTLGGGGSRGSGKIQFKFSEPYLISSKDYKNGNGNFNKELTEINKSTSEINFPGENKTNENSKAQAEG